jgi:hypothetical protein
MATTEEEEEKRKRNKTLPRDQQKLADAAANGSDAGVMDPVNSNAAFKLAEGANDAGGLALLGAGALNFAAKKTGSAALASAGGAVGAAAPLAAALYGGYQAGTALDKAFDFSGKIASGVGGLFGMDINKGAITPEERVAMASGRNPAVEQKGNIVQPAMSPQEIQGSRDGLNVNKPITGATDSSALTGKFGAGKESNVVGFEPLAQKSQEELSAAAREDVGAQFEGSYQAKDGSMIGQLVGGGSRVMSPDEVSAFEEKLKLDQTPMISGTPQEGLVAFKSQNDDLVYGNKFAADQFSPSPQAPAPQAPQITKQIEAQSNFLDAREAGQMTADKINDAQDFASSMGREFDQEKGYTSDFDPEILASYKRRQQAGEFGEASGVSANTSGRSSYSQESANREARMDEKPDFGVAQMRVGGKMVEATKENRAQRDIETSLKQEARAARYTPAQTRAYIADEMKKRSESTEDRATQKAMDELNMTTSQVNLQSKIASMMPKADNMKREDYFGFIKGLDSMGISVDPETGNLTTVDENFLLPNGEMNMSPDSDLYQKILGMEGGKDFLAAPKDVSSFSEGQPAGAKIRATDGTNRVYEVKEDGSLEQIG